MSTLYVILGVIISTIVAFSAFVIIGAVEKHRHVNVNWVILMTTIILGCSLAMVLIYHAENDLTIADTKQAYDNGYETGVADTKHTLPSNEEMENWFSSTKEVVVGSNGSDYAVHIIDGNGEEWVLYADEVVEK